MAHSLLLINTRPVVVDRYRGYLMRRTGEQWQICRSVRSAGIVPIWRATSLAHGYQIVDEYLEARGNPDMLRLFRSRRKPAMHRQSGFTLIELMIVVAIVGVLAALALPQYQDYLVRSKLVEEITFLDAAKISLTEAAQTQGAFPASSPVSTTVPANAKYMSAVSYNVAGANAAVVTTLANTGSATMNGTFVGVFGLLNADGTVTWTCGTAAAATSTAAGAVSTQYPFLPASCQH